MQICIIAIFQEWKNEGNLLNALTEDLNGPSEWNNLNQQIELSDQREQNDQVQVGGQKDLNRAGGRNNLDRMGGHNDLDGQDDLSQPGGLDECLTISETPTFESDQQQDQQPTVSNEPSSSKALKKPPSHDEPDSEEGTNNVHFVYNVVTVCHILPTSSLPSQKITLILNSLSSFLLQHHLKLH